MYPIILILLASACRLLPHAPNFTPIGAIALFAGSEIKDLRLAIGVTLGSMILSDLVIGSDVTSIAVYLALTISVFVGRYLKSSVSFRTGFISAFACAVIFFLVTNFAVWGWSGIYPRTLLGLSECFVAAIPFFRNTLVSDILYLGALSSIYYLGRLGLPRLRLFAS